MSRRFDDTRITDPGGLFIFDDVLSVRDLIYRMDVAAEISNCCFAGIVVQIIIFNSYLDILDFVIEFDE